MRDLILKCSRQLELSAAERAFLAPAAPDAVVFCDLQGRHPEPHVATGVETWGGTWWVHWSDCGREIVKKQRCPGQADHGCLLPLGHPGAHSYQLSRQRLINA
ncbi:hypothetical protein [Catellatospora methionotrophica]|uniref:hypothetical protein n=1 Tax=Catellatospora methionotrophica TaxID=121620 RepID=UPI0014073082|nr:hypothetical protein [Catellatospora methionotrophica]